MKETYRRQPGRAPLWFRWALALSGAGWLLLQAIAEYFTLTTLYSYTHLTLFQPERQVDSSLLNLVSVGLLTILLAAGFLYGAVCSSRLAVLASASLLACLLVLNVIAVSVLMSSKFGISMGMTSPDDTPELNIYHYNMTTPHWRQEIERRSSTGWGDTSVLDFVQRQASCCGALGRQDYPETEPLPASCRCVEKEEQCSSESLQLENGKTSRVWRRGCAEVVGDFTSGLRHLSSLLAATIVFQLVVVLLTVLLAVNMPADVERVEVSD